MTATSVSPADYFTGKWRETHREMLSRGRSPLCRLGSGRGLARPPTGAHSADACQAEATVVNLTFPQAKGSVLFDTSGNKCRGLTEKTLRKCAHTLFFLAFK